MKISQDAILGLHNYDDITRRNMQHKKKIAQCTDFNQHRKTSNTDISQLLSGDLGTSCK